MHDSNESRQAEARRCTEAMRDVLLGYKARLEEAMRPTGITLPQLRMLRAIEQGSDVSAAAIARRCHVTPQTLQSILDRATRAGWIVRGSSEANGRFVTASLTSAGEAILAHGKEVGAAIEREIWQDVSLATMTLLRGVLEAGVVKLEAAAALPVSGKQGIQPT